MDKLCGDKNNPNAAIFEVPTLEGHDATDQGHGSIGDATQDHIFALTQAQEMVWQEYVHMGDGKLYRMIPNTGFQDRDNQQLKNMVDRALPKASDDEDKKKLLAYQADFEAEETEKLESTEDAMNHRDHLVPYDDWERAPGLMSHVDLPATPKDAAIPAGNCSQVFYDSFPEGHPSQKLITQIMQLMNRDWDDIDEGFASWVIKAVIDTSGARKYVKEELSLMCMRLATTMDPPTGVVERCLKNIDYMWGKEYHRFTMRRIGTTKAYSLIVARSEEFKLLRKQGKPVYNLVSKLGADLYKMGRANNTANTWKMYRRLKTKYAPCILVKGTRYIHHDDDGKVISRGDHQVNINTATVSQMTRHLDITDAKAREIFHQRPFSTKWEFESQFDNRAQLPKEECDSLWWESMMNTPEAEMDRD